MIQINIFQYFNYFLLQVSWLKNGGNLNLMPGVAGRLSMTNAHELVITEVQYSDAGTYTCEASNVNGEAFNRTYLTIVGKKSHKGND